MFAGVAVLVALTLISAALGVFSYVVGQKLEAASRNLERQAFETRRRIDQQNNRINDQEAAIRLLYARRGGGARRGAFTPPTPDEIGEARAAATEYLQMGRRMPPADERVMSFLRRQRGEEPIGALATGVGRLLDFDRGAETVAPGSTDLPPRLRTALAAFEAAKGEPDLEPAALAGVARLRFVLAAASNYEARACQGVLDSVAAAERRGPPGAQLLYWRAQCERKLGRAAEALAHYAGALQASGGGAAARPASADPDEAQLTLAMNSLHGLGTTLIASFDLPDSQVRSALTLAQAACAPGGAAARMRNPRMQLALACLNRAIELRKELHQTPNQVSGSAENLSFAFLRDGNLEAAFANAQAVERTGLFAWNELVRASTAEQLGRGDEFRTASAEARRNLSFFEVRQFNLCELRELLSEADYRRASEILAETHRGQQVQCVAR
jgi:tetratricopeptide (TPR) repeat protein